MTSRMRVAVLGGGVLGASTAAALAKQGADVTLMTAGRLASGASGRSLAWLNSFGPRSPEYHNLRLLGLDRYRTLAAETGSPAFLRFDGGLTWPSDDSVGDHRKAFEHMRNIGYACEWLSPEEVSTRTPGVDPAVVCTEGAIFNPQEGWVDLPGLIEHLAAIVAVNGGAIRTDSGHSEVVLTGGRVTAVRSGDGAETPVDVAVLATGADVPLTVKELGVVIQTRRRLRSSCELHQSAPLCVPSSTPRASQFDLLPTAPWSWTPGGRSEKSSSAQTGPTRRGRRQSRVCWRRQRASWRVIHG